MKCGILRLARTALAAMLVACGVLSLSADEWYDSSTGYTWYYRVHGDGVEIFNNDCTAALSSKPSGELEIPAKIAGRSVTSIGGWAFVDCSDLTRITMPDSVEHIGECAFFRCENLASVEFPQNVKSIGYSAFMSCSSLVDVVLPDSVSDIGENAFGWCCELENVTLGSGVKHIGGSAFYECDKLTHLTIPDGVETLGERFIGECDGLTSIDIPNSVTNIGREAFWCCRSLEAVSIGDGVRDLDYGTFSGCTQLEDVKLGNGITNIHWTAFDPSANIKNLVAPQYVCGVGISALGQGSCESLTNITISESVAYIGDSAFLGCSGLTSMTIPGNVADIGDSAFYGCSGLADVAIGNSVTNIGAWAFANCSGLTSVTIPDSVTDIGDSAFSYCSGLTDVTIGSGVTNIGMWAFNGCCSLTNVTFEGNAPQMGDLAFSSVASTCCVYVHSGSTGWNIAIPGQWYGIDIAYIEGGSSIGDGGSARLTAVVNGVEWTYFVTDGKAIVGYSEEAIDVWGNTYTRDRPAVPVDTAGAVAIPAKLGGYPVVGINSDAFYECGNITSITIPNGVKTIGEFAFAGCSNLTKITIPASVTRIADDAFAWCTKLTAIALNSSNKSFVYAGGMLLSANKKRIFAVSRAATSISVPNGVTVLPYGFLAGCTKLTTVALPKSVVETVDGWADAFGYDTCTSLKTIKVDAKNPAVKVVNGILFEKSDLSHIAYIPAGLASVTIPASVTSLGASDFENNHAKLASVTVPPSVTSIASDAFAGFGNSVKITVSRYAAPEWTAGYFSGGVTVVRGLLGEPEFRYVNRYDYNWGDAEDGEYEPDNGDGIVITGGSNMKGTVTIPANIDGRAVTGIGRKAFKKNTKITSVAMPETVNRVGYNAFGSCTALKSVKIAGGESVVMGQFSFSGCSGLAKNGFVVVNGVLYHYTGKGGVVTIPSTVRIIDDEVFRGNKKVTAVNIPSSVMEIRSEAFEYCTKLTRVTFAEGIRILGEKVFWGCWAMRRYNIPASAILSEEEDFGFAPVDSWFEPIGLSRQLKSFTGPESDYVDWEYTVPSGVTFNKTIDVVFDAAGGTVDGEAKVGIKVAYLDALWSVAPALYTPVRKGYTFKGWYTAKAKGYKISANTVVSKAVTYYAQWTPKKYKITVKAGPGGKAARTGSYNCGSTVKFTATPNKGYVFVRWDDAEFDVAHDEDYETLWTAYGKQRRAAPLSLKVPPGNLTLTAIFAKAAADAVAPVVSYADGDYLGWNIEDAPDLEIPISVTGSLSFAPLKANNLPPGVGLVLLEDSEDHGERYVLKVTDKKKLRPGSWNTKFYAANRSGRRSNTLALAIVGRNMTAAVDAGVVSGLETSTSRPYEFQAGTKTSFSLAGLGASVAGGWSLSKVTGLPSGWTFKNGRISGAAAPGTYTLFFTFAKGKTKTVTQASATFVVDPLPEWATGTFCGSVAEYSPSRGHDMLNANATITVSAAGKVSGSFSDIYNNTKCTFSGTGLVYGEDGGLSAKVSGKLGKKAISFDIFLGEDRSAAFGFAVGKKNYSSFNCYQVFGTAKYGGSEDGYSSLVGKTLKFSIDYADEDWWFTFGQNGTVKIKGTFTYSSGSRRWVFSGTGSSRIVKDAASDRTYIPLAVKFNNKESEIARNIELVFHCDASADGGYSYEFVERYPGVHEW